MRTFQILTSILLIPQYWEGIGSQTNLKPDSLSSNLVPREPAKAFFLSLASPAVRKRQVRTKPSLCVFITRFGVTARRSPGSDWSHGEADLHEVKRAQREAGKDPPVTPATRTAAVTWREYCAAPRRPQPDADRPWPVMAQGSADTAGRGTRCSGRHRGDGNAALEQKPQGTSPLPAPARGVSLASRAR